MRKVLAIVLAVCCMFTFSFATAFAGSPGGGGGTDPVSQVVNEIKTLPDPDKVTLADKTAIEQARKDYNALTDEQKKDPKLTDEVMKKLTDCEAALKTAEDKDAADKVAKQIEALPADPATSDKAAVAAAQAAYDALTADQQKLISEADLLKLQNATYYWNKQDAAARTIVLVSAKAVKGKKIKATWTTEATGQTGYQVAYSYKKKFTKKTTKYKYVSDPAATSYTIKKLKAGKKYYVKVRVATAVYNPTTKANENVYGPWSNVKKSKKVKK